MRAGAGKGLPPPSPEELARLVCGVQAEMLRNLAALVEESRIPLLAKDEQVIGYELAIRGFTTRKRLPDARRPR